MKLSTAACTVVLTLVLSAIYCAAGDIICEHCFGRTAQEVEKPADQSASGPCGAPMRGSRRKPVPCPIIRQKKFYRCSVARCAGLSSGNSPEDADEVNRCAHFFKYPIVEQGASSSTARYHHFM
ncbi:hypothetical protein PGT21_024453 [Puccinia graminis f. sp. tritici]|uniref:Secreted protein n=1 Tax=Puccinia graminis f. sp. tritici TaxID=56615 RepID=A0A5B0NNR3_PUCGR|nr:hypothetical protein PGT21_024453 [Puccinia graminis f. sp. tritici]